MPVSANPRASSLLVTAPPQASEEDAAAIAIEVFGIRATARGLSSERDRNFELRAEDGRRFVLKVTNAAEEPDVSNLQTEALRHIEAYAPQLPVPRARAAIDGRFEAWARLANGSTHLVRVLTFLPGDPLHRTPSSPRQIVELGRTLAEIGLALRDFRHPAASRDLLWDLKRAPDLRALLPHIADGERRALATRALDNYEAQVRPRLAAFRSQVVHNDFNPHNILVDPEEPARVTGVLDFGDVVATPLVNDVAIAAAYQVEGQNPLGRAAAFVAAYHTTCPLLPEEVDSLFDLITLRQAMTVVIAEWRASLYPDNSAYILRNQPRAATALEHLSRIGRAEGGARLRQACKME